MNTAGLRRAIASALWAAAMLLPALPQAQQVAVPALDQQAAIAASQAALGRSVGDYTLLDREGRPVGLAFYRGKPLLVSFIYTGCFQVCPLNTRSLLAAVRGLAARFGPDQFNVVSIGFNQPADSPQAMKSFATQNGVAQPNWNFLSPPAAIVPDLTRDFGFRYAATPAGFDHVLQVSLLDAQGRIVRQIYGDQVPADALGEPLKELLAGAPLAPEAPLAGLLAQVRLLCTVYDPKTGSYRVDYSLPLEIAGGLTFIFAVGWYLFNEWRTQRRARRAVLRT
jgi:protein SCO1/2